VAESTSSAVYWILAVLAVGLLIAMNPSRDAHKTEAYAQMRRQANKDGVLAQIGAATAESADALELTGIEYQSFLIASTLTHDDKLVTIGVLGMVFVVDE
jgi:hypothetical protein